MQYCLPSQVPALEKILVSFEYLAVSRGGLWYKVASRICEFRETPQGLQNLRVGYVAPRRRETA